jgi:hypothetical protein
LHSVKQADPVLVLRSWCGKQEMSIFSGRPSGD